MRYIILILYIALFHWLGNEFSEPGVHIAFLGGIIRAVGAGKEAKRLQKKADGMNPVRPEYQIPQEIQALLDNSYNQAQGDVAGYGRAIGQAQGNTANTLGNARNFADSGSSLLQNLAMAGESERRNVNDINMNNQQFKQGANAQLNNSLQTKAGFEDQAFQFNEADPYFQAEQDKRAYQEAAMNQKNASRDAWGSFADGIINTGLSIGTAGMAGGGSLFGNLFGKKNKAG
tara:strand:- start:468 stop:1160 length:693 start_codon:yes stop_codon:yes gene_type:complete